MIKVEEIGGGYLNLVDPEGWECCATLISNDTEKLSRILKTPFGHEVQYLKKSSGAPQWKGDWWGEVTNSSITDSLEHAEILAKLYLANA
jgi:hypothetical protein